MSAFDIEQLSLDLRMQYDNMKADGINAMPCLKCNKTVTFNKFNELVESGKYEHHEIAEMLMTGTHPECFRAIFYEADEGS